MWCGTSNATAENAVDPESPEVKSREAQAAQLIKNLLRDPPYRKPSKECEQFLTSEGFDIEDGGKPKLNLFRVRKLAGVKTKRFPKEKFYCWYHEVTPVEEELRFTATNDSE